MIEVWVGLLDTPPTSRIHSLELQELLFRQICSSGAVLFTP